MPIFTAEQLQELIATYASGIVEVDVPGEKRIRYADPATLRKILTDAETASGGTAEVTGTRTFALFRRDI